jgi:hypothetical protein
MEEDSPSCENDRCTVSSTAGFIFVGPAVQDAFSAHLPFEATPFNRGLAKRKQLLMKRCVHTV